MLQLHCPTPGCSWTPRDWFHHGLAADTPAKVFHSKVLLLYFGGSAAR